MSGKHAVLGPSGAERWLNCTPSARLEQQFPDTAGDAAKEGTLAHSLGELIIRNKISSHVNNMPTLTGIEFEMCMSEIKANKFYSAEMLNHCDDYATFVLEEFAKSQVQTKDALIYLEQRIDLTKYIPEGFGTGDVIIIADGTLKSIDLKYGKGVPVSAENNKQTMLYALGAVEEFEVMFDLKDVEMVIYQPRLDSISTFTMTVADLKKWVNEELIPRAALAFEGLGTFAPGKHCRFCKARAVCKANADYNLEIAKYDFKDGALLDDAAIADILNRASTFEKWLKGVEDYALSEAVLNGKKWPGYKVVEGKSNRKYSDDATVAGALVEGGWQPDQIYNKKLLGLTDMQALLTKPVFEKTVGPYIIKPPGKPTLVPESDKRPVFDKIEAAANDFADVLDV